MEPGHKRQIVTLSSPSWCVLNIEMVSFKFSPLLSGVLVGRREPNDFPDRRKLSSASGHLEKVLPSNTIQVLPSNNSQLLVDQYLAGVHTL